MGSQIPSFAHNASVSSNPPCYAGYHHSQHMASCSLHTIQGEKSCPANPFLHWEQRSRCWSSRCSSWCCYPVLCQPDIQPLHQGRYQGWQQEHKQQNIWRTDISKWSSGVCCWVCWGCSG